MRLGKLGTALTVIFIVCLIAIAAELFYVFRRRRRRTASTAGDEVSVSSYKELLCFFCVKSPSYSNKNSAAIEAEKEDENISEVIDLDLFKIGGAFGANPRFLFTIKEEEREGLDSPKELIGAKKVCEERTIGKMTLEECFRVDVDGADVDSGTMPYSSPEALSPVFFTPSASPVREQV